MNRNRTHQFLLICLTILIGLVSRTSYVPELLFPYAGDFLYALMFFFIVGFAFPKLESIKVAGVAVLICYCIEGSQLLEFDFLNKLRSHRLGGLVLGHGFLWSDILAYTFGGLAGFGIERYFVKNSA